MDRLRILSLIFVALSILPTYIKAQNWIEGVVKGAIEGGQTEDLYGASVYWSGTTLGVTTDTTGHFKIQSNSGTRELVVSFIGYLPDTILVDGNKFLDIKLIQNNQLEAVEIEYRQKTTTIDFLEAKKVETIGERELLKAACCNLSESFETSPSVDVSFTDAVTGTRQIEMLGLAGPYTQIMRENIPDVRGLSAVQGLTYTPGTWIDAIQLNKGTGSVVNGYESIAGQINVNLRNPSMMDKVYLNAYANQMGRFEMNSNIGLDVGDKWGTAILLHGKLNSIRNDRNNDGFLDNPLSKQFIGLNRWELYNDQGLHFQFGVKGTYIDNLGGQSDFSLDDKGSNSIWGMSMLTNRIEGWTKIGKVNQGKPYESFGFQLSASHHDQKSFFGLRGYDASQNMLYGNFIFQSIIGSTNHQYKAGMSFQYDDFNEVFDLVNYDRTEVVPGAFFEYTFQGSDRFNAVAGIRGDYHNLFGAFVTPRVHLRYLLTENTVLRASGGRGQRTANLLSENMGLMASSRNFIIEGDGSSKPYGLNPEVAWNYGLNLTHEFSLDYRDGSITFDFYRTDFKNQIVVDRDTNPQEVHFYNLDGESFSNSFQAQLDYELVKRLDIRLAYRWFDVQTTYGNELLKKPFVSSNRAFMNLAYETRDHWRFDYTANWQGKKRISNTVSNPSEYTLSGYSPDFVLMNAQISKSWRDEIFEIYSGVENLLNFRQENPILSSEEPFSPYFDSSLVWGPIFGRNIYLGLRYRIR
ncbi:MAG: TonB-dependent receptor plug domain-containing protein [Bacteroidota bacterium]